MSRLNDQFAVITGGGRGIGRGIARAFARAGAALLLTGRHDDVLAATAAELTASGAQVLTCVGDVADERHVEEVFALADRQFGRIDLLVNNAGGFAGGPLDEFDLADWDRVIATNLRGPFLFTRAALQRMKRQRSGRIINIGSISAQRVRLHSAAYSTSKHGLWGLTQVTALEGREYGVTCGCLHPGNIAVERRVASGKLDDDEPMMSVDDLAEVALLMAALPPQVEMLESIVLPRDQRYLGRG